MISKDCSIDEFVKAVKKKDPEKVIKLAVKEADLADRIGLKSKKKTKVDSERSKKYSLQLKQLISLHRNYVKPRSPRKKVYRLYMRYWGDSDK